MTWLRNAVVAVLTAFSALAATEASAQTHSAFFLSRSENRNQVHYALRLDEACRPVGTQPVFVYWRMLERGESEVEDLLGVEQPVYGLDGTQQVEATADGWKVRIRLRAFPERPIDITTTASRGPCTVQAWTKVGAHVAQLEHIFVKTSWPFSVDFVRLDGMTPDGSTVTELVRSRD
ncbi:DUF4833 domain-containing protein [Myxococcus landrumensis]|uniref:DUF4833 domain-containing protein n=1 Tax=Myxococcus landrumensis TaxID=2813577 RepID=A0ABX7NB56_9BACT|nr:DUF4833 domain-containing protein [Myxococcus landrumus]QSQ16016.1 DUF4833 domain-containing protein [Myxococcus landrumus]